MTGRDGLFDSFRGLAGNDTFAGGVGMVADRIDYSRDELHGGNAGVIVNLGTGAATDGFGHTDTFTGIEVVRGTNQADQMTGGGNLIFEEFLGLGGNDVIDGGGGFDEVDYSNEINFGGPSRGVVVNLATGTATDSFGSTDSLAGIEQVVGTNFIDRITGTAGNDRLFGLGDEDILTPGPGDDFIDGGANFDTLVYSEATVDLNISLGSGTANDGMGGTDTFVNIEGLFGGSGNDTLTGTNRPNQESFGGGPGNDTLIGAGGDLDELFYTTSPAGVTIDLLLNTAADGFGTTDSFSGFTGIEASPHDDTLLGTDGANVLDGRAGNDTINGRGGLDTAEYLQAVAGVFINLATGTAQDGFGTVDQLISIENAIGSRLNDEIIGSDDANNMQGDRGNDLFEGAGGNDFIDGQAGEDTARYAGAFSAYAVTIGSGTVTVTANSGSEGQDTLANVEFLQFSDRRIDVRVDSTTIDSPADIQSPDDGVTMYREVASDDAIARPREEAHAEFTFSDGGATATGTDFRNLFYFEEDTENVTVAGRGGDDVYIIRSLPEELTGGDPRIVEEEGGGEDTAWVNVNDYILSNGVENIVSMTERGIRMLANDDDNKFVGNIGDDELYAGFGDDIVWGGEGNDRIVGGDGDDALFGREGNDIFAWELDHVGDGDVIWDWNDGDQIDLQGLGGGIVTEQDGDNVRVFHDEDNDGAADRLIVTVIGVTDPQIDPAIIT